MTREQYLTETFTTIQERQPESGEECMQASFNIACEMADFLEAKGVAPWLNKHSEAVHGRFFKRG